MRVLVRLNEDEHRSILRKEDLTRISPAAGTKPLEGGSAGTEVRGGRLFTRRASGADRPGPR